MRPRNRQSIAAAVAAMDADTKATVHVPTEHQEQVRLFSTIDRHIKQYPDLACIAAVPNGLRTGIRTAVKAKAEGLRKGYPDIVVDVAMYCPKAKEMFHGLRIEMKRVKGGRVDPDQKVWHERLRARGYCVEVCRGCDEAWKVICEYLGIEGATI